MLGIWVYGLAGTYALLSHAGLRGVALAWASGNALSSLYIVANTYAVPVTLGHDADSRPRATRLVRMGLPYLTNSLAWQLVFATDSIVIASTLGTESVALYLPTFRLAEAIGYAALLPLTGLLPLMGAVFGAGDRSRLTTVLRRSTSVAVALAIAGGSLGAFFGGSAIRLWVGADYFAGPLVLGALMMFLIVRSVTATSANALASAGHMQQVAVITLLEGAVNLLLSLLLIRPLGISGVALATLLAHVAVSAWILPPAASRAHGIGLREWLVPATAHGIVAAAPAIVAALLFRIAWGEAVHPRTLVGQLCACGVAGALGFWMLALEPHERRTVWRAFSLRATA
jgi:O-antigen/teichoic acid export membrane protein